VLSPSGAESKGSSPSWRSSDIRCS